MMCDEELTAADQHTDRLLLLSSVGLLHIVVGHRNFCTSKQISSVDSKVVELAAI